MDVTTTTQPNPQTMDSSPIDCGAEGSVSGGTAGDDPMEIVVDSEPESVSICKRSDLLDECCHLRHSAAHESTSLGKVRDNEQGGVSYLICEDRCSSGLSPFFDGLGTNGTTVHDHGSPDTTDTPRRLPNPETRDQGVQWPEGRTGESANPITPGGGIRDRHVVPGTPDAGSLERNSTLLDVVPGEHPYGPPGNIDDIPADANGPHNFADVQGCPCGVNRASSSSLSSACDPTAPNHGQMHGAPVVVDVGVPYPPPRVRARGVFIVGNAAPIRIDEGIEVHLRDGVDGQVDFII